MANVAATAAPTGLPRLGAAGRTCRPVQLCATQRLSPSSVSLRVLRARGNPVGSRGPVPIRAQAAVADPAAPEAPTPVTKSREGGPPQTLEGSFIKKMLVVVAKFFISLLPGRLGLTWLAALLPSKVKAIFLSLFDNYVSEMVKAVRDRKRAEVVSMIVFKDMCKTYAEQMLLPYKFPSYHRAMRSPTDYYKMGQQYIGCLMDFERSILGYPERWTQVQEHISKGENVILLANHQSEGDAAFIPLMTEVSHPGLGSQVIYVAGDRVVSDKLCKPFSMGRNLLCVHSKKHIADDPATKSEKMRQNVQTLKEMERLLREGGQLIWIAPSGGRDRWNEAGDLLPARFDPAAVEMMVKLGTRKGVKKTHFIPMAMATAEIMPPPKATEKDLGEQRVVHFTGAGLSLAEEVDVSPEGPWAKGVDTGDKRAASQALADYIYDRVVEVYKPIAHCNVPGGEPQPLPANAMAPKKPDIVPR